MKHHHMTTTLVKSALMVALIFVFFTVFRGFANLLNAFLVPMALYVGLKEADRAQAFTLFAAVIIAALLFFSVQVFFILLYFAMALMLKQLMSRGASTVKMGLWLSVVATFGIYAGIRLTDLVFLTPLHRVYMAMLGGSWLYYGLFLLAEGLMAGFGLAAVARAVQRRMAHLG